MDVTQYIIAFGKNDECAVLSIENPTQWIPLQLPKQLEGVKIDVAAEPSGGLLVATWQKLEEAPTFALWHPGSAQAKPIPSPTTDSDVWLVSTAAGHVYCIVGTKTDQLNVFEFRDGSWSHAAARRGGWQPGMTLVAMADGRIMMCGGNKLWVNSNECVIYDPIAQTWTEAAPMQLKRANCAAVLLPKGRILVSGGWGESQCRMCEVYFPETNEWHLFPVGDMSIRRENHAMVSFAEGGDTKIVAIGGDWKGTTEILTLGGTWERGPALPEGWQEKRITAVRRFLSQ